VASPFNVVGKAHEAPRGGDFVWFVYGSSLDREAFAQWAAQHGYPVPDFGRARPARLRGHRLAFDTASRFWGGAVGSLVPSGGDAVEGLAVPMPGEARGLVDHKEGAISGLYEAFEVTLEPLDGEGAIPAIAYRTAPARRMTGEAPPAAAYLDVLLRGARSAGLSPEWVARLESLRR
jgi:gamma-glutamylcyclotransferase